MAPPKKGELIKGQASLANFFSGGGLTPAAVAAAAREKSGDQTPSPKKKSKSESSPSGLSQQQVTEVKEKVRGDSM
jgi:hypothetical protein